MALWMLSGTTQVSLYQKKHSPTHAYHGHHYQSPLSASSIYYDPWHPLCSIYVPDSLFPHSPSFLWSTPSLGTLHFILHTFLTLSTHFSATNVPTLCDLSSPPIQNSLYLLPVAP